MEQKVAEGKDRTEFEEWYLIEFNFDRHSSIRAEWLKWLKSHELVEAE